MLEITESNELNSYRLNITLETRKHKDVKHKTPRSRTRLTRVLERETYLLKDTKCIELSVILTLHSSWDNHRIKLSFLYSTTMLSKVRQDNLNKTID